MTPRPPASDIAAVHRAGRAAAVQASVALAAVLLVVGAVIFAVDVHAQNQQITAQLVSVASTADDVTDPPPGMVLALRDKAGNVSVGAHPSMTTHMLGGPTGFSDVRVGDQHYRALVADNSHGRVVALLDLQPYETGRSRLLVSLGAAELAGILVSIAVVVSLTRRSIRPLSQALALQRQFVADASHELRAPLTVLNTRAQVIARRFDHGDAHEAKNHIDALISDTRTLGDVIDDLLASASMATDTAPIDRIEVSALAHAVRETMSEHAQTAGVTLKAERD
jgi:signal transduction histidine kinase